jgi:hypothetical protein
MPTQQHNSISLGAALLLYASVKMAVCVGRRGGLAHNMPYSPLGLNHAVLDVFLVTSAFWLGLAAWAVMHLRKCKRVCYDVIMMSCLVAPEEMQER